MKHDFTRFFGPILFVNPQLFRLYDDYFLLKVGVLAVGLRAIVVVEVREFIHPFK